MASFGGNLSQPKMQITLDDIDSTNAKVDEILNGFDPLHFIPSSLIKNNNKSSMNNKINPIPNNNNKNNGNNNNSEQVTTTVTITPTSFTIEEHSNNNNNSIIKTDKQIKELCALPDLKTAKPMKSSLIENKYINRKWKKHNNNNNKKRSNNNNNDRKKTVHFSDQSKSSDGHSAKLYSCPLYLIRDGVYLRPKSAVQINCEKRLLQMLGAPQELAGRALPPGFLDLDLNEEYSPEIANDYDSFVCARMQLSDWIQMRRHQRSAAKQRADIISKKAKAFVANEIEIENKIENNNYSNAFINNNCNNNNGNQRKRNRNNNNNSGHGGRHRKKVKRHAHRERERDVNFMRTQRKMTGIDKAAKMMAKFGWKEGDGLGKSKQGLKGCLAPIGGYNQLMSVQDPTNVLLLQNMASKGEVDSELKSETINECMHFGNVIDCVIHETKMKNVSIEQEISVFVQFQTVESCVVALQTFNGRFFAGRRVIASFFPQNRFVNRDFDL